MKANRLFMLPLLMALLLVGGLTNAWGVAFVQCPEDLDGDGNLANNVDIANVQCKHLTGGDGWVTMADGREMYIFSFSDVSDMPAADVLDAGVFRANSPAPTIVTQENEELYLTLTNVGTFQRPDLFDPHTIHYHGFPNSSAIFDGLPESTVSINQQASITYYYNNIEPGTYMYHCHVEATEHMQMGMLGNLYVKPKQNVAGCDTGPCGPGQYVYNDNDGSTSYDVEYAIQLQAFDHVFHDASANTQPLPFSDMVDTYPTINGRGYPDTTLPTGQNPPIPADSTANPPQPVSSLITAASGQKILLRLSNLGVVQHYTVTVLGIPMQVVGRGARLLRGTGGQDVYYETNVVNIGGGETTDVLLDTANVESGTYFLYATNLNYLSNNQEDQGGYMTEIVIQ
jgi:FtsP/CotA-like multicopper oxidase with cupredoxin domain